MRNDRRWIWVALGIAAACGGRSAPPPQSPPPATGVESETKASGQPTPQADQSFAPPPAQQRVVTTMAPPPESPSAEHATETGETPGAVDPHTRYTRANVQFSEAKRQVDIAAGQRDCANACRALDSMERAMGQLCELASSTEEGRTCKSAEDQVRAARERVRNACGECPKKAR